MNATQPGGDARGFYAALGVPLPGWADTEAPVSCFTNPDAHAQHDQRPSCSVNVHSGAFNCHGCGAHGGAYDAALAVGRSPREAIDLMIAHGLTDRRPRPDPAPGATPSHAAAARSEVPVRIPSPAAASNRPVASSLSCSGEELRRWARALRDNDALLARLRVERGWETDTLRRWGIGFDGERITVPIADQRGALQGVLRLRVDAWQKPKVLAAAGSRLGLIPHPERVAGSVVLVEGPSDMLAARSAGLAAIAVPGTHAWRAEWASAFTGRDVTVVMDADRPGREAAVRIAADLQGYGARASIVGLDPGRDDGYDLSDWLRAGNDPDLVTDRSHARARHTRIAGSSGDVWTERIGVAMPTSRSAMSLDAEATAGVAGLVGAARSRGCAVF
ncbi:MAG: toprim domain-containing protein [Solirubrobacteraceae bacterium]